MSKIMSLIIAAALLCLAAVSAEAQRSPSEQFGVGISIGNLPGVQAQYAITPAIHVGTQLSLAINSEKRSGSSTSDNSLVFAPYGKFLFNGPATFKPYIMAQLVVASGGSRGFSPGVGSDLGLGAHAGAEYFVSEKLGIFAQVSVLTLGFGDNSFTSIGIVNPTVGLEWFF